jgi:parallel beta-helix repeat protein
MNKHINILFAILGVFALAGCESPLNSVKAPVSGASGAVTVSIQTLQTVGSTTERTIKPALDGFSRYELNFSNGPAAHEPVAISANANTPIELVVGEWTITATAYSGETAMAQGSATVTINADATTPVSITLGPVPEGTNGTLSYSVVSPSGATGSLAVQTATGGMVTGGSITLTAGTTENTLSLPSGEYMLFVNLTKGGIHAGRMDVLHIYPGKTSAATYSFTDADFSGGENFIPGYTITFNSQGGSAIASQAVTTGYTVPYPAEPTKAGAFFDGWYKEPGCSNLYNYGTPVSGPITLYAKWLTESEMIAGEFGASVPASNIFEVNNNTATASGETGWDNSWVKARTAIDNGGDGKNYVIKVVSNFQLASSSSSTFTPDNIKILIYTPTDRTISGGRIYVGANQTLILRNITLQGVDYGDTNAHLLMHPGAVVSGSVSAGSGTFTMSGGSSGGVSVGSGTFTMSGGTISGNTSRGVSIDSGTFTMSGGTISRNTVSSSYSYGGGGVSVGSGTFTMSGGTISGNTASSSSSSSFGGGVYGNITMNDGTISGNRAFYGGGMAGNITMSDGTISGNRASSSGGGVYVGSDTFTMDGGTISGNTASSSGGGVYVASSGTFTMGGGTVYGSGAGTGLPNTATSGASLAVEDATATAKYGNFYDLIANGLYTDETLVGHN